LRNIQRIFTELEYHRRGFLFLPLRFGPLIGDAIPGFIQFQGNCMVLSRLETVFIAKTAAGSISELKPSIETHTGVRQ